MNSATPEHSVTDTKERSTTARVVGASVVTVLGMFISIFVGGAPTFFSGAGVVMLIAGVGTSALAVLLVWLLRRRPSHRPLADLGLGSIGTAVVHLLAGVGTAAVMVMAANLMVAATGAGEWAGWDRIGQGLTMMPMALIPAFLVQGFPEELWFRGYLHARLSAWVSPAAVLAVTSGAFGALHIISGTGGITGIGVQLMWVVMATAMGFACGAARQLSGLLWMPVGIHTGFHMWNDLFFTVDALAAPGAFLMLVVAWTVAFAVAGVAMVWGASRRGVYQR